MRTTHRVARRILGTTLGLTALASLLLPGPVTAIASAAESHGAVDLPAARVGPERPVSEPGPLAPSRPEGMPAVASGGSVSLAAWPDAAEHVRFTRISRAGEVLDPAGVLLDPGVWGSKPVVSFDGTNFLVAWVSDQGLVARRVSPAGDVLDASNIVVSTRQTFGSTPAIDFDGTNHLVAWMSLNGRSNGDLYGRRVSPAGTVVDAADLTLSAVPANQQNVALAFNGTQHLLVWTNANADVYGTLVSTAGVAANPAGVPISNAPNIQSWPSVTAVGSSFFVAWADERNGAGPDIYGTRVTAAGAVTDPSGIAISTAPDAQFFPAVSSDGTSVLAGWSDQAFAASNARFTRIDASGAVLDPTGPDLATINSDTKLAFDGQDYIAVGLGDFAAQGVRVAPDGDVLDPDGILISAAPSWQRDLDMAFDGTNSFVVWSDNRLGFLRVYGGRSAPDGAILDGTGIAVSGGSDGPGSPDHQDENPAVAFDGTNHLVVWIEWANGDSTVQGARVSPAGDVLDRFVIASDPTSSVGRPVVTYGGGSFLVAWTTFDQATQLHGIDATRVSPAGAVLDPAGIPLKVPGPAQVDHLAVASGDATFLVAWNEAQNVAAPDIYGRRVSTAGTIVDPAAIAISTAPEAQRNVDVAWQGGNYLVVWDDERAGIRDPFGIASADIYGARIDGSGTVLDPAGIPISTDPADQRDPSVAANGRFFVAWSDRRRNLGMDVFGTRVETGGTVESPNGQVVAPDSSYASGPVVSPGSGNGRFVVAYTRYDAPRATDRAYLRTVAPK